MCRLRAQWCCETLILAAAVRLAILRVRNGRWWRGVTKCVCSVWVWSFARFCLSIAAWAIICVVVLSVGRPMVLSEGGWLMVLVGYTSVESKCNIMFSIVCLCSWYAGLKAFIAAWLGSVFF